MGVHESVTGALAGVERRWSRLVERAKRAGLRRQAVRVLPYNGYGNRERLWLRGRVLEEARISSPSPDAGALENLRNMIRRYRSDEVLGADLELRLGGLRVDLESDDDGFFEVELAPPGPVEVRAPWTEAEVHLRSPFGPGQSQESAVARIRVPGRSARLGVISDVDDTIVHTGATDLLRHARTVLLNNAYTRKPLHGVAALYRALRDGPEGEAANPFFYVSSSPWNVYDLFERFLEWHRMPIGPILLRDMGLERGRFFKAGHETYKAGVIADILSTYPELPFLLVGDSGQRDLFAYRDVVRRWPGRVLAVYIRVVGPGRAEAEVAPVREELAGAGVELVLAHDSLDVGRHAARRGWIAEDRLPEIEFDARPVE